jgi:hypothetical protein
VIGRVLPVVLSATAVLVSAGQCVRAAGPFVISGKQNLTYKGLIISNPAGNCIEISKNSSNIRIESSQIGPCGKNGIAVSNSSVVTIASSYIHDAPQYGITSYLANSLTITGNRIEHVGTGVMNLDSTRVKIRENRFLNVNGAVPGGQFVQFNRVRGGGNEISGNIGENIPGQSAPQDAINLFDSSGDATDPIVVASNKIRGGGPSPYGGGIMLGDGGGSWQVARDNILVDAGQYGIAIASGTNIQVLRNSVYARQQPFTNVGVYVWNQYSSPCYGHTVQDNLVNYTNSSGQKNAYWNAGNCSAVNGESMNDWNASLTEQIFDNAVAAPSSQRLYLSDLPLRTVANGWGPAELNMSNGEMAARDGRQLSIGGVRFTKGIGVHASSDVRYTMSGKCSTFSARVGVDDEVRPNGSVIFRVFADGVKLFDTGVRTGSMAATDVFVNVEGRKELSLVVLPGTTGNFAHADWADAVLICRP